VRRAETISFPIHAVELFPFPFFLSNLPNFLFKQSIAHEDSAPSFLPAMKESYFPPPPFPKKALSLVSTGQDQLLCWSCPLFPLASHRSRRRMFGSLLAVLGFSHAC